MLKKIGGGCLGLIGLLVVAGVVIGIIAVVASNSGSDKKGDTGAASSAAPTSGNGGGTHKKKAGLDASQGAVNKVVAGKPYRLGDFKIHKGWRVHNVGYGMGYEVKGLTVENLTNSDHSFSVNIKLHKGAQRIVSNIQCFAQTAHPKEIVNVDCIPDGTAGKYDYVTVENSL